MKLFPAHTWKRQYQVQNAEYKLNFCFIKWKYVNIQRYCLYSQRETVEG